ncbi:MAG: PQQ-binding-like beta-propeller repeat protein [Planctomycetota bacterium]
MLPTLQRDGSFAFATAVLAVVLAGSSAAEDFTWKLPRGDAAASGFSPATLPESLTVGWEFKADDAIEDTPVLDGERVFVVDGTGTIYGLSQKSGSELWRKQYDTIFLTSPVIAGDRLIIGDIDGNVYALSASEGKELWHREIEGQVYSAAGIDGDRGLIATDGGTLYCFNLADGTSVWEYQADDQIRCSPTVVGERTFLGGCDSQLHIINLKTGEAEGKKLELDGPTGSTPAVLGDAAILPIMDGSVFAFDWKTQKQLWLYEDREQSQEYETSAAVSEKMVVVTSKRRQVDGLNPKTGERVWRATLKRFADASPVIAGDDVWIAASDGRLLRLDLASGKQKWEHEIRGGFASGPAVTDKELIIGDDNGVVRCFRSK